MNQLTVTYHYAAKIQIPPNQKMRKYGTQFLQNHKGALDFFKLQRNTYIEAAEE